MRKRLALLITGILVVGALTVWAVGSVLAQGDTKPMQHKGGRGPGDASFLAEALGISVDELQTAQQEAQDAALQAALDQGLITQEQYDAMILRAGGLHFGRGIKDLRGKGGFGPDSGIDHDALLADALSISVDELDAARQQAQESALEQAIADGSITQEEVDQMRARQALQSYLDPQALLAQALGINAEQLQDYRDQGLTMTQILDDVDMTAVQVREAMQVAHQDAVAQAVSDGVITQEQADQLQNGRFGDMGFKGPHGPGREGGRPFGGFGKP